MNFVKLLAGEDGVPIIKILAVIFPVLLFLFKYILPWLAEAANDVPSGKRTQIKVELIQFPVDLMFVAIGYTIPQIIEIILDLSIINITNDSGASDYNKLILALSKNCVFTVAALLVIPFFVFGSKVALNDFFSKKFIKMTIVLLLLYLLAAISIWFSIFS